MKAKTTAITSGNRKFAKFSIVAVAAIAGITITAISVSQDRFE